MKNYTTAKSKCGVRSGNQPTREIICSQLNKPGSPAKCFDIPANDEFEPVLPLPDGEIIIDGCLFSDHISDDGEILMEIDGELHSYSVTLNRGYELNRSAVEAHTK
jgi:hypothetical protein